MSKSGAHERINRILTERGITAEMIQERVQKNHGNGRQPTVRIYTDTYAISHGMGTTKRFYADTFSRGAVAAMLELITESTEASGSQ